MTTLRISVWSSLPSEVRAVPLYVQLSPLAVEAIPLHISNETESTFAVPVMSVKFTSSSAYSLDENAGTSPVMPIPAGTNMRFVDKHSGLDVEKAHPVLLWT